MILLLSGGLDSTVAYFYLKPERAIYIDLHTKYTKKEIEALDQISQIAGGSGLGFDYQVVNGPDLSQFQVGEKAYIPRRNLLLATIAAMYDSKVVLVGIKGDKVEDKSPCAFAEMSSCMNHISKKGIDPEVLIDSPFWFWNKEQIVGWFVNKFSYEVALKILKASVSCYWEEPGQCGHCPSCLRKAVALTYNKIDCLSWFHSPINEWSGIKQYIQGMKEGKYDLARSEAMKKVFTSWGWAVE